MTNICDLDNTINGLKIKLNTGCLATELFKINEIIGSLAYNLIDKIDLNINLNDKILIGLKKCSCNDNNCENPITKKCIDHILYVLVNEKNC